MLTGGQPVSPAGGIVVEMVQDLILRTGPALIARRPAPDDEQQGRPLRDVDATDRAHEVLFEPVTLDAAVTLGDVFRLMDASPLLQQVFRRDFATELCAEARKGPVAKAGAGPGSHEAIEVLELYQEWRMDSSTNSYSSIQRLQLHGVGPELTQDAPEHGRKKGERIQWSVSLEPLREFLALPLRVNPEVQLIEDDIDAKAYGMEIARARHPDVTLGEIIHSLLWELSFHGGPQEQVAMRDELKTRVAELEAGTVVAIPADDIFGELDRPGCDALFDDLGGRSAREIGIALRDIDDDQNAAAWLDRTFGGSVVVKPQFRDRNGRQFRKAFRAAAR